MTSFLSARKRAEEFADAVEAVLAFSSSGLPARAQPVGEPLLDLVLTLRSAPAPAPRPDFTVALRQRLLAEAVTVLTPGSPSPLGPDRVPPRPRSRSRGKVVVAAGALVAVGGTAGVATAAQSALPGDALYSVKRAIEGAQFTLSASDAGRGRDLLGQAGHRLEEVGGLLGSDSGSDVEDQLSGTVQAFSSQAAEGSGLLLDAYREDDDEQAVLDVRSFTAQSMDTLADLAQTAPAQVRDELFVAARTVRDLDRDAVAACATCGAEAPLRIPPGFGRPPVEAGTDDGAGDPDSWTETTDELFPNAAPTVGDEGPLAVPGSPGATGLPSPSVGLPSDGVTPSGTPGPTDAPTGVPTEVPTEVPTDGPTEVPTDVPTEVPTDPPSEAPTPDPTAPSGQPSGGPTDDGGGEGDGEQGMTTGADPSAGSGTSAPEDTGTGDSPGAGSRGGKGSVR